MNNLCSLCRAQYIHKICIYGSRTIFFSNGQPTLGVFACLFLRLQRVRVCSGSKDWAQAKGLLDGIGWCIEQLAAIEQTGTSKRGPKMSLWQKGVRTERAFKRTPNSGTRPACTIAHRFVLPLFVWHRLSGFTATKWVEEWVDVYGATIWGTMDVYRPDERVHANQHFFFLTLCFYEFVVQRKVCGSYWGVVKSCRFFSWTTGLHTICAYWQPTPICIQAKYFDENLHIYDAQFQVAVPERVCVWVPYGMIMTADSEGRWRADGSRF